MPEKPALSGRSWLLPALVAVVAVVLIALLFWPGGDDSDSEAAVEQETQGEEGPADVAGPEGADPGEVVDPAEGQEELDLTFVERRDVQDPLAAGEVDAPVVLVIFSDYQCPYCASWSHETLPELMDHVEAAELRVEWRDLNIFGPASDRASRASYAAGLQGRFWEYHDELFPGGEIRPESQLGDDDLVTLAEDLGLDTEQFAQDMDSAEVEDQIRENQQLGLDLGAHSTPAFVFGGEPVVGAQPTEVFLEAMDDALAEAQD